MKNFVQAWSDKTQVRLGLHRNIVISGVFGGRENEYLQNTAMGRDFPGIFGDTVFVNTCPLFDNFYQSFEKKRLADVIKKGNGKSEETCRNTCIDVTEISIEMLIYHYTPV